MELDDVWASFAAARKQSEEYSATPDESRNLIEKSDCMCETPVLDQDR